MSTEYDIGWENGRDFQAEKFALLAKEWANTKERLEVCEKALRQIAEGEHPEEAPEIAKEALRNGKSRGIKEITT